MQLKDNQGVALSIVVEDSFGNPTSSPLDAAPAWAMDDASLADLQVSDDGMSVKVLPKGGKLGSFKVQVSATVAGAAVAGEFPIEVIPGDAAKIEVKAGEVFAQ